MKIYLFRHGETAYTLEHRYLGVTDLPLSESGRQKLRAIDAWSPHVVYTSGMLRTKETADILFPQTPQIAVPGLAEMDFGVFEGRNYQEMEFDRDYRAWVDSGCKDRCPGGESQAEFTERICTAFAPLVDHAQEEKREELTIVAHGGTIMAVLSTFALPEKDYFSWSTPPGGGYILEAERWQSKRKLDIIRKIPAERGTP